MKNNWSSVVLAALLIGVAVSSLRWSGPPDALSDDAAETAFSAARAMPHVRAIAERPHPMGSADHARVREYVISALQRLGFVVERQRATAVRLRGRGSAPRGTVLAGSVENLMVRLAGTASSGAVLLASHYDSVSAGPGAADDAAGVAAVLETLRALKAGGALRNDVIALFTDGEEDGLLGAEAFVSRHPWARDVRAVLNFEARGNRGAVQMFETTPGNAAVVRAWAEEVPSPAGASLAYEVYKRLPNDSDFTELKRLDAVGLNFAFIDNVEAYHTPGDAPDALQAGSVQALGDAALALARRLGDASLDLKAWRGRDAVFFSVPGGFAIHYSVLWAIPLVVLALSVWIWVLVRARRRGHASIGGVVLAVIILALFVAIETWAGLKTSGWLVTLQTWWQPFAAPLTNGAYALSLLCFCVFDWLVVYVVMRKKFAAHTLSLAATALILVAAGALAAILPGASYLTVWPLLAALMATALLPASPGGKPAGAVAVLVLTVLAVPALAILGPTAATLVSALLLSREGAAGLVVLVTLGLSTLLPQVEVVTQGRRWWPAFVAFLAGVGALAAGGYTAPYGPSHPRPENVIYALDAGARRAVWATAVDPPGEWLAQFVTESPKRGPLSNFQAVAGAATFSSSEAPMVDLAAPVVTLASSIDEGGGRLLSIRITSPRRARALSVRIPDREILDTRVNGRPVGSREGPQGWAAGRWGLEYANVPAEGVDVTVRVKGTNSITVIVADRSDGIPAVPGVSFQPRPPASQPVHRGDMTLVQKAYGF